MAKVKGARMFDGFLPNRESPDDTVWPPRHRTIKSFTDVLKLLDAKLSGGKLVWLRDHDDVHTLTVAHVNANGKLSAPRYWPYYRQCVLNEDGTVSPVEQGNTLYARHWIDANKTEMVMMLFKNSEVYAQTSPNP